MAEQAIRDLKKDYDTSMKGLAEIKDNSEALKFVINDMVAKGL